MKFICKVEFKRYNATRGIRIYLNRDAVKLVGDNVIFNIKRLEMTRPSLDCKHYKSIEKGTFSIHPPNDEIDGLIGWYNLYQKDEDTFIFKKVKKNGIHNELH